MSKAFEYVARGASTIVGGACAAFGAVAAVQMVRHGVDPQAVAIPLTAAALSVPYLAAGLVPRESMQVLQRLGL